VPRKLRIDLAGYHHVINRGVNGSVVFVDSKDYEQFLKIVCKACRKYRVILHDYALMSNHFHLLVETKRDNLSLFMKHINGNYAICANKKQKRSGHFWQGRFYSRYINSDKYYYALIRYIEQNPIEAGLAKEVTEYPYTLGSVVANNIKPAPCCLHSKLLIELKYKNIQKIIEKDSVKGQAYTKSLDQHFKDTKSKQERNSAILEAINDGYAQIEVAKY